MNLGQAHTQGQNLRIIFRIIREFWLGAFGSVFGNQLPVLEPVLSPTSNLMDRRPFSWLSFYFSEVHWFFELETNQSFSSSSSKILHKEVNSEQSNEQQT